MAGIWGQAGNRRRWPCSPSCMANAHLTCSLGLAPHLVQQVIRCWTGIPACVQCHLQTREPIPTAKKAQVSCSSHPPPPPAPTPSASCPARPGRLAWAPQTRADWGTGCRTSPWKVLEWFWSTGNFATFVNKKVRPRAPRLNPLLVPGALACGAPSSRWGDEGPRPAGAAPSCAWNSGHEAIDPCVHRHQATA